MDAIAEALQNRKRRQNVTAFNALVASPTASPFVMVASGKLQFVSIAGCAAGTTAATVVGTTNRTIKTPLLGAGRGVVIDWLERGATVTPANGFDVYLDSGLGKWKKIAS